MLAALTPFLTPYRAELPSRPSHEPPPPPRTTPITARCRPSTARPSGSTPSRSPPPGSAGASSSSTSGRTRASTGCARCRTSGRGTSATASAGSSSWACTRPSSASSTTSTTCAARSPTLDVGYPVVIDNDFAIWRSLDNHYWPAVYLVDGEGRVRFQHFGEEAYEETERAIQQLLGVDEGLVDVDAGGLAEPADWGALRSPETYLGSARGERGSERATGWRDQWALAGEWSVRRPPCSTAPTGSITCRFEARDVNLVLAPPDSGGPVAVLRAPRRRAARRGARTRRRRARRGHAVRAAAVPARTPGEGPSTRGPSRSRSHGPGARAYVFTFG